MTPETAQQMIQAFTAQLSEHFDAVQILVSYPAPNGGTQALQAGSGNWYARQGMAHEFIQRDRANEFAHAIKSE